MLIASGLLVTSLGGTSMASTATKRVVHATPAVGLKNGETVTVTGSGFKAHEQIIVLECLAGATGATQCDIADASAVTTTGKGVLPKTTFHVKTGKIGNGSCGTSSSNLKGCVINAGTVSGTDTATVAIAFRAPRS
jgi:hypothetical protein